MTQTARSNSLQRAAALLKKHAGAAGDERGFVLVMALGLLSVCLLIGMAAMNTSVDELEISTNEVLARRTFTYAMAGTPLAALAITQKNGHGSYPSDGCRLDSETNPDDTGAYYVTVLDKDFLKEDPDMDAKTGWNNLCKYIYATGTQQPLFKPEDDLNVPDPCVSPCPSKKTASPGADILIQKMLDGDAVAGGMFTMLVDIDKMGTQADAGGSNSAGDDPDAILLFSMDSKATLPGRSLTDTNAPMNETVAGYYFRPRAF